MLNCQRTGIYMNLSLLNKMHGYKCEGLRGAKFFYFRVDSLTFCWSRHLIYAWKFIVKLKTFTMDATIAALTGTGTPESLLESRRVNPAPFSREEKYFVPDDFARPTSISLVHLNFKTVCAYTCVCRYKYRLCTYVYVISRELNRSREAGQTSVLGGVCVRRRGRRTKEGTRYGENKQTRPPPGANKVTTASL